jgi:hypothetical protein
MDTICNIMTDPSQGNHIVIYAVLLSRNRNFGGAMVFEGAEWTNIIMDTICNIIE